MRDLFRQMNHIEVYRILKNCFWEMKWRHCLYTSLEENRTLKNLVHCPSLSNASGQWILDRALCQSFNLNYNLTCSSYFRHTIGRRIRFFEIGCFCEMTIHSIGSKVATAPTWIVPKVDSSTPLWILTTNYRTRAGKCNRTCSDRLMTLYAYQLLDSFFST